MSAVHEIVTGGGAQTIAIVPPCRATGATYQIEDLSKGNDQADRYLVGAVGVPAAATLDATELVVSAAAGADTTDAYAIPAAASALVTGRAYAIEAADAQREVFTCTGRDATSCTAEQPLTGAYPSGSKIRGLRVSGTFPAAQADDDNFFEEDRPLRVIWHLTIGGVVTTVAEPIRLVRALFQDKYIGDLDVWLRNTWRELVQQLGSKGEHTRTLCVQAANVVAGKLRAKGIDPGRYLAGPSGQNAMQARVVLELAQRGHKPGTIDIVSFLEDARREWAEMWSDLTLGADPRDTLETTRSNDAATASQPRKQRRLVRRA